MEKYRRQDDEKALVRYLPQYVMWLKDLFGIRKDFKVTDRRHLAQFVKKCYFGESEEYEDQECWEITKDYEDVSANRRVLVKTKFIIGKMYE